MRIRDGIKLDFDDVLIVPKRSLLKSRKDVVLTREFRFYHSPKTLNVCPIVSANMFATGSFSIARELVKEKMLTCLHKFYTCGELVGFFSENIKHQDLVFVSIGQSVKDLEKISNLGFEPNIRIDVANGNRDDFVNFCDSVRDLFPNSVIMAGNVCTPEMVQELIIHGRVDIVAVGIGPGSVCETRKVTGCGYPQLSAIDECSSAAHGLKSAEKRIGLVCGDGGCNSPGDVCKAFAAGADFVMLGGMFAGCSECNGKWIGHEAVLTQESDKMSGTFVPTHLEFYGMSSLEAQDNHNGGMQEHRSSEGKCVVVKYKGLVNLVAKNIAGGLRSCCTYIGASSIKDMPKCAEFVRVNRTHNTIYGN